MEELAKLEAERGNPTYLGDGRGTEGKAGRVASNEMCTFLILNISSLQLIPVNMIAYRQQYGSVNPAGIIAPAIVATIATRFRKWATERLKEYMVKGFTMDDECLKDNGGMYRMNFKQQGV